VLLVRTTDYTATNGTSVVLALAATASDTLVVVAYGAFNVANTYTQAQSDARFYQTAVTPSSSNPVLNAAQAIWQRGISISLAASQGNVYTSDRWSISTTANAATTVSQQVTGDTTNLPNIQYCSRVQRNSGQTGTTGQFLYQTFESINSIPFAGKTVTLSFYIRAGATFLSSAATMTAKLWSGTGTDQNILSGLTGQVQVAAVTPTLTATWQRVTVTGTVGTTATQIGLGFDMGAVGTAGATDYLETTGWQIDIGSVALPFRTYAATIQGELAACQRYYQKSYAIGVAPGTSTPGDYSMTMVENNIPNNNYYHYQPLIVQTRTAPTVTIYSAFGNTTKVTTTAGSDLAANSGVAVLINDNHFNIQNLSGGALTASAGGFLFYYVASAEL
jgi:hypothetical protein